MGAIGVNLRSYSYSLPKLIQKILEFVDESTLTA
jgi:hypothetical protein